jgi:thioesterase domain-containing protein
MFLPLAAGATLVVGGGAAWTPGEWARGAAELAVTVADLPPAYLQEVVESAPPPLPALRVLLTGADAVPSALVRRWQGEVETGARLVNAYGPTEAVVTATAFAAPDGFPDGFAGPVAPIGTALPGRAAYLLDPFGAPAADGVPGELCLGGVLARGYLGRPALTAERFVPDPFSATPGARMYRTGDRVRFAEVREYGSTEVRRSHGADEAPVLPYSRTFVLQFLGRIDAQVKVRGFRVEPGEVEAALALHPAVREAAVVARGGDGDRRLVGYVVPAPGAETPSPAALRAHLRERLPEWMVPSAFVAMDGFPLTANGKLDRAALPDPAAGGDDEAYVAPRDALELRLAQAWEALLGVPRVGVRDDFFALGGHSLLAMRALAAVERATGRRVPLATLLAGPTVERLARALRDGAGFPAPGPLVPLQPAGTRRPLFLVHAAGGNVVSYAALARRLGADQPVYGLQSRGVDGGEEPAASVEAMARDYLAEVRRTQPAGPYRLGGWSMGGLVAFEMARLLEADGERVELLALVDSPAPEEGAPLPDPDDPRLLASFVLHLGLPPERITLSAAEAAALPPAERLRLAWEAALAADVVAAELGMDGFRRLWTVFRANAAAAAASEAERWGALAAGGVRAAVVPGDHFTLVREPHVGRLAQHLAAALAAAEEEP